MKHMFQSRNRESSNFKTAIYDFLARSEALFQSRNRESSNFKQDYGLDAKIGDTVSIS